VSAIDILMQRNVEFAARRHTPNLTLAATLGIIVIGCVDPRVDPAHVLGLEPGEAAVLRNVGGRVTPATLQMLSLLGTLPRLLGAPRPDRGMNLVVLQHTDCGITRLARTPERLAPYFGVSPDQLDGLAVLDPYASVRVDVAALKSAPSLPAGSTVIGLVYDVATGRVEIVVPTTPLGDAGSTA
jgi:carbonic anhydrase